jgi:glutathione-regulated potassium-efflux system ancillary protein KefC
MPEHNLLLDALIYLAAAVVCVPIASRLGLGSVLGYLVAGCAIGPHILGLVTDVQSIMHFAELGVVLMLFVIGLELEPKRLWGLRRMVFGGGTLQLFVCCALLLPAGIAAGLPWQAALIAALALSLSSTAIAVQTMNERNLMRAPVGRASFGVLLSAQAEGRFELTGALKGLVAIVVVIGVGRYLTRPMLQAVARTGLREVFTAFALLLVLGIAQVMALAELSMALGAFLAGVLLADSEYRHALETDLEPFKGLLMGLFFISVGMSIDFGLLASDPLLVVLLVVGYQGIKGAALAWMAPRLEVGKRERWLFGALLAQGGEFAFVVFGVARASHALPGAWDGLLTLTVALSMALTPLLLIVRDRVSARHLDEDKKAADAIDPDDAQVIVAGFGRFGQVVGRLLFASGVRATVLDHDPDQIEMLRRFGFRVFYGDATRLDLLEAAGAARATLLVNAIDDIGDSLALVDLVREHFPKLEIVARARNVTHYFELRARGVSIVERETFESAMLTGRRVLERLGASPYEARERADTFRRHNVRSLEALLPHLKDESRRLSMAKAARTELEKQFERDRAELEQGATRGWQDELESADEGRSPRAR